MKQLSIENLPRLSAKIVTPPTTNFDLPEKVIQFGTGVLLRGLCDYFISKANDQGIFNGRIVIVKSTSQGDGQSFANQDNLYTLCIRGIDEGKEVKENYICSSISRVLSAKEEWKEILKCASNKELRVVISNTTEVGISLVKESIFQDPPASFPAKLLAFLYERFKQLHGAAGTGMVIIPTELISDNGKKLQEILLALAAHNSLDDAFISWLKEENHFCNSLVDRIVAGKPDAAKYQQLQDELGYTDELLAVCEVYRLWAIEGNEKVKSILSFSEADPGVIVQPNIESFKALKLHLLNGTHTLTCGLAYLSGFDFVKDGLANKYVSNFVSTTMQQEIATAIPYELSEKQIREFALKVLDRFRNPHIEHLWLNITVQYAAKMKMRNVPVLQKYNATFNKTPQYMATGFAAFLFFMKGVKVENDKYYGQRNDSYYHINDEKAKYFYDTWNDNKTAAALVAAVIRNQELWGTDLSLLNGFEQSVLKALESMMTKGVAETIKAL